MRVVIVGQPYIQRWCFLRVTSIAPTDESSIGHIDGLSRIPSGRRGCAALRHLFEILISSGTSSTAWVYIRLGLWFACGAPVSLSVTVSRWTTVRRTRPCGDDRVD